VEGERRKGGEGGRGSKAERMKGLRWWKEEVYDGLISK
jgi:hypothetical protein